MEGKCVMEHDSYKGHCLSKCENTGCICLLGGTVVLQGTLLAPSYFVPHTGERKMRLRRWVLVYRWNFKKKVKVVLYPLEESTHPLRLSVCFFLISVYSWLINSTFLHLFSIKHPMFHVVKTSLCQLIIILDTVLCTLALPLFFRNVINSIPRLCQDMPLLAFSLGKKQSNAKHPKYTYGLSIIVLKIVDHDLWIKHVKLQVIYYLWKFHECSFIKVLSSLSEIWLR